jgi:hypothetical protein
MVLIPFQEYERLVEAAEDAADARDEDKIRRRLATGEEELIPAEIVDRMIDVREGIGRGNGPRRALHRAARDWHARGNHLDVQEARRRASRRYRRYRLARAPLIPVTVTLHSIGLSFTSGL